MKWVFLMFFGLGLIYRLNIIMEKIEVTQQEIWQATRPLIARNKKKYNRKEKHPKKPKDD